MDAYLRPEEVNHPCDNIMAILAAAEHMGLVLPASDEDSTNRSVCRSAGAAAVSP